MHAEGVAAQGGGNAAGVGTGPEVRGPHAEPAHSQVPRMRHRLYDCRKAWRKMITCTLVLGWVCKGFPFQFLEDNPPPMGMAPNHRSVAEHAVYVSNQVDELLAAGTVVPWAPEYGDGPRPHLVCPLKVVVQNGKERLIYDARMLNAHLVIPPFKYEDLATCKTYIQPNDWMTVLDLSKGYHHLDIHPDYWKYLGFEWEGNFYVYTGMPFGVAVAPWAFTTMMREVLGIWKLQGHRCSGYIDDQLHAHGNRKWLDDFMHSVVYPDLEKLGFLVNKKKSMRWSSQLVKYLGMMINTLSGEFLFPEDKREALHQQLQDAIKTQAHCSFKLVESIAGRIAAARWAFGSISRLMSLSLHADLKAAGQASKLRLSEAAVADIQFWETAVSEWNGHGRIWPVVDFQPIRLYTDAAGRNEDSLGGWGAWSGDVGQGRWTALGKWAENEWEGAQESSTLAEMRAVRLALESLGRARRLSGRTVIVCTDNQGTCFNILKAGSTAPGIHLECRRIFWYCIRQDIQLTARWIPRELNQVADFYSKLVDYSDWQLLPAVFAEVQARLQVTFSADMFASHNTYLIDRYFSLYYTPGCVDVDAFGRRWEGTPWCHPPFSLIARAIRHGQLSEVRMGLLCPCTPGAAWWHMVAASSSHFHRYVVRCLPLGIGRHLLTRGTAAGAQGGKPCHWNLMVLILDFSREVALCPYPLPIPTPRQFPVMLRW
jgi:ribonuclease HI